MKLGVFDSGLGGLTVVKAIRALRPDLDIVYLGDTARVPYGDRSPETIVRYALECSNFFDQFKGAEKINALLVACNTVSAIGIPALVEKNEIPVLGVLEPGAKAAAKYNRVGLVATHATVNSGAYERALKIFNPKVQLTAEAAPLLVPFVEEGWVIGKMVSEVVAKSIKPLVGAQVEVIILGCTHYPLLKPIFEAELAKMNWSVPLIDSGEELAHQLFPNATKSSSKPTGKLDIFTTDGSNEHFKKSAELYLSEALSEIQRAEL